MTVVVIREPTHSIVLKGDKGDPGDPGDPGADAAGAVISVNTRVGAVTGLAEQADLADEVDRATGAEGDLGDLIGALPTMSALTAETTRASAAEATKLAANHASVTNARMPTAHASTHGVAGSDPVALTPAQITGLIVSGKIDPALIPALPVGSTFVVGSEAEMIALAAVQGDIAKRTDISGGAPYVLTTADPTVALNWVRLTGDYALQSDLDDKADDADVGHKNVAETISAVWDFAAGLTQSGHAVVDATHTALTNARNPTGVAGGVLAGTYPNPGFAVDMATQDELDAVSTAVGTRATTTALTTETTRASAAEAAGVNAFNGLFVGGKFDPALSPIPPDGRVFNVKDRVYGAKGDAKFIRASMSASGTTVTALTAQFASTDVGKTIGVIGAGAGGTCLITTISSFNSSTQVVVATAATTAVTEARVCFGTNDTTATNAAYADALAASLTGPPTTVYWPGGSYIRTAQFTAQSNVGMAGDSMFGTTIVPMGTDIACVWGNTAFTAIAPGHDINYHDFGVEGAFNNTVTAGAKAFYAARLFRSSWRNLWIRNTGATGLGVDHLQECIIANNIIENCGRLNDGTQPSGAGIGIGTGGLSDHESCLIVGNTSINNKMYGIFVEIQSSPAVPADGYVIANNYCSGNQKAGISDAGAQGTIIMGNSVVNNNLGIVLDTGTYTPGDPGKEGQIIGNVIRYNTYDGIRCDYSVKNTSGKFSFRNNVIGWNGANGINMLCDTQNIVAQVVESNTIHDNGRCGILVGYNGATMTGVLQTSAFDRNNITNNGSAAVANNQDGIRINTPMVDTEISENKIFDRKGTKTQAYGITCAAAVTGGKVTGNDIRNNLTGTMRFTGTAPSDTTELARNLGYSPPAPVAVTPGASPWTFTAPSVPGWLMVIGGTVSSITLAGVSVAMTTGQHIPYEPGDAIVVTYSVAPSVFTRRR